MTEQQAPKLIVNGESSTFVPELAQLLEEHDISAHSKGVAVARNGVIVPRQQWAGTQLQPGDRIDIVGAVQGG